MRTAKRKLLSGLLCAVMIMTACSCGRREKEKGVEKVAGDYVKKKLNLCVGDTYNFAAMGYTVNKLEGTALYLVDNTVTAYAAGTDEVIVSDPLLKQYSFQVTVYETAAELGDRYPLDQGMFEGKQVIAFGDSITDGCLLDPDKPTNYDDTYFAKLCRYLGTASDPTDLENSNFTCGGTTLTYGLRGGYGISGVERVDETHPFTDGGRIRNPYPNILTADLCVIEYGANDFDEDVLTGTAWDRPEKAEDAVTLRGGMYYMIRRLRELNPNLKILVLPPLFRRADGTNLLWTEDLTDVQNAKTGETLRGYAQALREMCEEYGALFIDWYPVFNYENFGRIDAGQYTEDGLHPNAAGHELLYQYLFKYITNERND